MDKGRVPATRHFLGWDEPLPKKVGDFLWPARPARPIDLSAFLLIVPTRQAGRRLREALARRAAEHDTGLLAPLVAGPDEVLDTMRSTTRVASRGLVAAVWTRVLKDLRIRDHAALFPLAPPAQDFAWASRMAFTLARLAEELAEAGLTMSSVAAQFADALAEPERWTDLARIEKAYLDRLARLQWQDPCAARIAAADAPALPRGVRTVVLAGVPDLAPLVVRALAQIAERHPVEILVHAPEGEALRFDEWGRPKFDAWADVAIDVTDASEQIVLGGSPAGQSRAVLDALDREAPVFDADQTAIGVPDADVTPFLSAALAERGLKTFDPAGRALRDHPLYQLLDTVRRLMADGDFASFAALLRHADVLAHLAEGPRVSATRLLLELDDFQNAFLPSGLDDVMECFRRVPGLEKGNASLFAAIRFVAKLRERFRDAPVRDALRDTFRQIYALRQVRPSETRDADFLAVARAINDAVEELDAASVASLKLGPADFLDLLTQRLRDERYYPEPAGASLDLEGWIELPWNDAPLLVITGMNEGVVPDSRCADPFLPDSLRRVLGLRHEAERCARDAFLLRGLLEARRTHGRVVLMAGRTRSTGDPLRPSRLLFRCGSKELLERSRILFGEPREPRPQYAATVAFKLDPKVPDPKPITVMNVTMFRDYLACPFRFYLRHVLGMERVDDRKAELDALDFGTLMHQALQGLKGGALDRSTDADAVAGLLCGAADAWIRERFGSDPPLQILIQQEAARQRLRAAALHHAKSVADGWELVAVERLFTLRLGGLEVRGKVDRIERHRPSGAWRLLDYKTSDQDDTPAKAHVGRARDGVADYATLTVGGKPSRWIDLQLPLYCMLLASDPEFAGASDVQLGYFNLPKAVGDAGIVMWDDFRDELLASARTCTAGVVADIERGKFWPPAERVRDDEFEALLLGRPSDNVEPLS